MDVRYEKLLDQLQRGTIDRRTFLVRAVALGVSGSAIYSSLSRVGLAAAQERAPPRSATRISRTSKGPTRA